MTNFTIHFTLCLIFRRFWPIFIYTYIYTRNLLRHEQVCLIMFNERYSFERCFFRYWVWLNMFMMWYIYCIANTEQTSENIYHIYLWHAKCSNLAEVRWPLWKGASSLYIKPCWQSLYKVFPTGEMGESPHQPKICSFTPSPPNFYSLPPKVNSTQ